MRRTALVAAAFLVAAAAITGVAAADQHCTFPHETEDSTGVNVVVDEKPDRIVTLAPSTTQTLIELEDDDRIVGTESNSVAQYPEVSDVPSVTYNMSGASMFDDGSTEMILDLEPDIVVGALIANDPIVEELRDAGVTVYVSGSPGSLPGIYDKVEEKGSLTGSCDAADDVIDWMQHEAGIVETTVSGANPVSVYYHGGYQPYLTTTDASFVGDVIERSGGWLLMRYDDYGTGWLWDFDEEILIDEFATEDPEWIVRPDNAWGAPEIPDYDYWQDTTAVTENHILDVHPDYIQQSAPRVVVPMANMAETFHPDRYEQAEKIAEEDSTDRAGAGVDDYLEMFDIQEARIEPGEDYSIATFPGPVREIAFDGRLEGTVTVTSNPPTEAPGNPGYGFDISIPADTATGTLTTEPMDEPPSNHQWIAKYTDGEWRLEDTDVLTVDEDLLRTDASFSRFAVLASTEPEPVISVVESNGSTLTVTGGSSEDSYGYIESYSWTVDNDTTPEETLTVDVDDRTVVKVELEVSNDAGLTASTVETFEVGEDDEIERVDSDYAEDDLDPEDDDEDLPMPGLGVVAALTALTAVAAHRLGLSS